MNYNPIFFITSAALTGGNLVLTINGTPSIAERNTARFLFAPNVAVPAGVTADTPVTIAIGAESYVLQDKFGMPLTFSELPVVTSVLSGVTTQFFATRRPIVCGIGSDGAETPTFFFIAWNLPIPSEFIIPLR